MTETIEYLKATISSQSAIISILTDVIIEMESVLDKAASAGYIRRDFPHGQGVGSAVTMMEKAL